MGIMENHIDIYLAKISLKTKCYIVKQIILNKWKCCKMFVINFLRMQIIQFHFCAHSHQHRFLFFVSNSKLLIILQIMRGKIWMGTFEECGWLHILVLRQHDWYFFDGLQTPTQKWFVITVSTLDVMFPPVCWLDFRKSRRMFYLQSAHLYPSALKGRKSLVCFLILFYYFIALTSPIPHLLCMKRT